MDNVRPYVDPTATDVDLSVYPEPVDSTGKIRGGKELLETIVGGLEKELVVAKVTNFYCLGAYRRYFFVGVIGKIFF